MSPRLRSQIVKELLSYLRDPRSRISLVLPPLMQLFIFSFAVTLDVSNIDVAVFNDDAGRWSNEMIARIGASGFVGDVITTHKVGELGRMIDDREAIAAIRFPADFSRNIAAGRPAAVQVILDGRRANAAQITLGYLNTIAFDLGAELIDAQGVVLPEIAVRHWFNPNLVYQWFVVPGLVGVLAMFSSLIITALSIARERELGTFDQLLVSPTTPLEIVIAKSVPAMIIGTLLGSVMITAGIFAFAIPFTGSLWLLIPSLVLFILSVVGIGLMVSAISQTQQQAVLGVFSIGVPVILISGFATPIENMPRWLQFVAEASPLKHFLIIAQGSFLRAPTMAEVFANAWPMMLIAMVTLSSAILIVRSKLH